MSNLNPFTQGSYQNRALQEMFDKGRDMQTQINNFHFFRNALGSMLLNDLQQAFLVRRLGELILKICMKTSNPSVAATSYPCNKPERNPFNNNDCTNEVLEKKFNDGAKILPKEQMTKSHHFKAMVHIIEMWEEFAEENHFNKIVASYMVRELATLSREMVMSRQMAIGEIDNNHTGGMGRE